MTVSSIPPASARYGTISIPMYPKPITMPESGNSVASSTWSLVMKSTSSMPGVSGTFTLDPVAMTT